MTFKRMMRTVIIPSSFSVIMSSLRSGSSCNSHIKVHALRMCLVWIIIHMYSPKRCQAVFYNNWAKQTATTIQYAHDTLRRLYDITFRNELYFLKSSSNNSSIREDDNVKFKRDYAMEVRQTTFWAK
ncbi:hypothetical protein BDB00DRAFT_862976 [Zychaea mexicana]|uniref:uncharacterized protein n=1 Tax=Zychaea mexicana TaxID=64656 RepID=UPI0022FDFAE4|nr:uncharacterized protein BDB00DRAFT_862976 [Zychaea mexicana]KAI9469632.1 hypothetical protein BDB00DRAFT_862976 [Zychaea mexicana]